MNSSVYPVLFRMALDYLPIQASAVPCERVFSSSAETDTNRRNRIEPQLMEALQMLKFLLKKRRLEFGQDWTVTDEELEELSEKLVSITTGASASSTESQGDGTSTTDVTAELQVDSEHESNM